MRKFVIGMAMASTALTAPAMAREGQWYIQGDGGAMLVEDIVFDVNGNAGDAEAGYDEGYDFGAAVGHDFGAFRLEAEASYRAAGLDELQAGTVGLQAGNPAGGAGTSVFGQTLPAAGEYNALSFMLNGLFDFGSDDGIQGFFGGGVGVARVDLDGTVALSGPGAFDDSDTGLAWQLLAGIRAPLSDSWDVGIKYRYFNAENVSIIDTRGFDFETDVSSHSILGSIIYNFGGEAPPPPPPPPPPPAPPPPPPPPPAPAAPPPPPPCNTGPYIVFFDWDESAITAEAATILDNAVTAYANCGSASVMLAGHTDRSGSVTYNMGLAERRNSSVREYLTGRGVPGGRISSEAFGESQPRVATADGVRELQNRRVEVTYGPGSGM
ncbi:OmpA family protein [Erythrobacter sp. JK5]|uniref:OmpA family protein n=1 Tax=Erythrobacter sp. JK5 TaxID=2829500 RepID=UPI001BA9B7CD|nr:OmpA family protein [Erythrobacter sp. JK5]QUL37484.1 OmpA family protein [Erythrobacter sp. JK5]